MSQNENNGEDKCGCVRVCFYKIKRAKQVDFFPDFSGDKRKKQKKEDRETDFRLYLYRSKSS